jgi:DNA-directed RNA polymerase specialized sigma24 family protein
VDDEDLLRRVARRDEGAFRLLYARHAAAVYGLLCRLAGRADAGELLHETWLRAFRHLSLFHGLAPFGSWLTGIAVNCHREWRRRHSHVGTFGVALTPPAVHDRFSPEEEAALTVPVASIDPPPGEEDRLVAALRQRGLLRQARGTPALAWTLAAFAVAVTLAWLLWWHPAARILR